MASSSYRFHLIKHGRTLATELMECDDDGDAMQKAKQLLSASTFNSVEVWQNTPKSAWLNDGPGNRPIGSVSKLAFIERNPASCPAEP